jgi:acetolactate synthase-1/2/3 large subunit
MTAQELATATMYQAGVLIIVFNNGMYGTIRMHQERNFPARVVGTDLVNPRFDLLAQSFGSYGTVVESSSQFGPALAEALAFTRTRKLPAVIELRTDADVITPGTTLAAIRASAQSPR